MATVHFNVGTEDKPLRLGADKPSASVNRHDDLPLFRFGLRQLLLFVAALAHCSLSLASSTV